MRRFLQGLGLGLLIAAIVMGISSRGGAGANESVVERAKELGMVFPQGTEEPGKNEADKLLDDEDEQDTATGAAVKGAGVGGDSTDAESTEEPEKTTAPSEKPKSSKSPKSTVKPSKTSEPTTNPDRNADADPSKIKHLEKGTKVKFKVRSGLLSSSVARELQEAGIIDDQWEFDHYIVRHGYGDSIIAGTYELKAGDSYANIAKIITHKA